MPVDLFSTHYRIDSSRVLRQSLCGKFEFSAEFSSKLSQFFGCMGSGSHLDHPASIFLDRTVLGLYFRMHNLATVSDNSVR